MSRPASAWATPRRTLLAAGLLALAALLLAPGKAWAQSSSTEAPSGSGEASEAPAAAPGPDTPVPSGQPAVSGGPLEPGWFDVGGRVRAAVYGWLDELVESAMGVPLDLLGATVLATPQVSGPGRVRELWSATAVVANGAYVLLVVLGGVVVSGHETLQTRYSVKEVVPRLVIGAVAGNASLFAVGEAIKGANALSAALVADPGVTFADVAQTVRDVVLPSMGSPFSLLLGVAIGVLVVTLLLACVVRVALVVLLAAAAPLALACHALPQTERLAFLWWRSLGACLGVQVAHALTLVVGLRVFFSDAERVDGPAGAFFGLPNAVGAVDLLVLVALLWVMVRIPVWAGRVTFAGRRRGGRTALMARSYVVLRLVRKAAAKL